MVEKVVVFKKQLLRNLGLLLGYWLIFIIMPFFITSNDHKESYFYVIVFILLFLSPLFIFIPLRLAKFNHSLEVIIYLLVGWSIPVICIINIIDRIKYMNIGWF